MKPSGSEAVCYWLSVHRRQKPGRPTASLWVLWKHLVHLGEQEDHTHAGSYCSSNHSSWKTMLRIMGVTACWICDTQVCPFSVSIQAELRRVSTQCTELEKRPPETFESSVRRVIIGLHLTQQKAIRINAKLCMGGKCSLKKHASTFSSTAIKESYSLSKMI